MEFNQVRESVAERTQTTNEAGGEAFEPVTPERALTTVVINNLLEDTYYLDDEESLRLVCERVDAIAAENPEFALKLAAFAREEMYLRDISQLLLVLAAHDDRTKQYVPEYARGIIQRADEPCTVTAMNDELFGSTTGSDGFRARLEEPVGALEKLEQAKQWRRTNSQLAEDAATGRVSATLPKPLKRGINDALHTFDDHQYAKYDRPQRQVNIRDVINRTHPVPQDDERDEIFERLMLGDLDEYEDVEPLDTPETWEVVLSENKTHGVTEIIPVSAAGRGSVNYGFDVGDGRVFVTQSQKTGEVKVSIPAEVNTDRVKIATADGYAEQPPNPLSGEYPTSSVTGTDETVTLGRPTADVQLAVTVYIDQAREAWEDVLPEMGLFALIRNFRNMLQAGVPEETILEQVSLEWVENSKLYPFRFYQSYKALQDADIRAPEIERWLSEAIDVSAESLPDDLSETLVSADLSGSMTDSLSDGSDMTYKEISALFGAMLARNGAIASGFATGFELLEAHVDTPTLELAEKLRGMEIGHNTNGWKAIKFLRENELETDRIILLTDEQIWDSTKRRAPPGLTTPAEEESNTVREEFIQYRDEVAPDARLYIIDLSSYGTLSTPEGMPGVYRISGWSEKVLDFIEYAESEDEIIDEIENYEVTRSDSR